MLAVKAQAPELRLTPGAANRDGHDPSSPVIEQALAILTMLDYFGAPGRPSPDTIDKWVRQRRKDLGEQLPRARPRRR